MEDKKCYICKKCGGHHWCFPNAIECCQDLSSDKIKQKISEEKQWGFCRHCGKKINSPEETESN